MAKLLKLRRGTTTQHGSFTGAEGEVTIDTTKDTAVVHDGSTAGGRPLAREDMNNVPAGTILGTQLENSGVTAGQYGSSSAIPIVTVDAQGLVTAASTTAIDSTTIANGTSNVAVANNGDITATRSGTARLVVDDAGVDVTGALNVSSNGSVVGTFSAQSFTTNNGGLILNSTEPTISMVDSNGSPDYQIKVNGGVFDIRDSTGNTSKFNISATGEVNSQGKLNCQAGLDTDGDVVFNSDTTNVGVTFDASTSNLNLSDSQSLSFGDHSTTGDYSLSYVNGSDFTILGMNGGSGNLVLGTYANGTTTETLISNRSNNALELYFNGSKKLETVTGGVSVLGDLTASGVLKTTGNVLTVEGATPRLNLIDTNSDSDFEIGNTNGTLNIVDSTNNVNRLRVHSNGTVDILGNLDAHSGVDVTGNITVTGTVDGRDVAADGTKLDGIESGATADQTASEILSLISDQHIRTTAQIGRDSNDHFQFTDNDRLDLYLNGNNEFRFEADGDFHADGDVIAYSTTTASDENLKKDITTVTDAVAKAEALKGVTFTWKKDDQKSAGVIAQDVEKVLPEAVRTVSDFDGNEYKAVNYGALTSILIEAVKDLSARVKVLEAK